MGNNRADCIAKTSYTKSGIRVEGHAYIATLAFLDEEHDRWYYVDICEHCNHATVAFADSDMESQHYPEVRRVAGNET